MTVKRLAETFLASGVVPLLRRYSVGHDGIILAFHNVVPAGEPTASDRSLHLLQADFAGQLDRLKRTHDVVPLTQLLSGLQGRRPRAALTFDDGCRGLMTVGVEELARRNLPATCFVVPGRLGGPAFWWDRWRDTSDGLSASARDLALGTLRGEDRLVDDHAETAGWIRTNPPHHAAPATEAEIRDAAAYDRLDFGAHSWSHPNLAAIDGDALRNELVQPLRWLADSGLRSNRWLAYPYGLTSPAVTAAAEAAGYDGALLIGRHPPPGLQRGRFTKPRVNIPAGVSLAGFDLRAAGWPL